MTLLQTKLHIPSARSSLVLRPRLIEKLNQALNGKLTLVSAPAGFGKTTLVSEWIQTLDRQTAWLSLDKNDNDVAQFLTYLIAALQSIERELGKTAVSLLQSPQPPQFESVVTSLINDISQLADPFILVLDDYHVISENLIHESIGFLLNHMPSQMHLVITTRANPPLALARLRARGQMGEIRVQDLRFTAVETASLLNEQMAFNLSQADVDALAHRTEGWITGLQLAAISLQDRQDTTAFIQSFTGSNQFILDYLLEEVLQQQPSHIQSFLTETAVLKRMSGPLCNVVTGQEGGQSILEQLQKANLFIVSLDDKREWFRYHHLFADLLTHRLRRKQPDLVPKLHIRASQWYEAMGFIDDALHHAHAVADYDRATRLIFENSRQKVMRGETTVVFRWMSAMPPEQIHAHPYLAIAKAWQMLYSMQLQQIEPYLTSASQLLDMHDYGTENQTMRGEILGIRALTVHYQGENQQAVQLSRQSLQLLPLENKFARSIILTALGSALRNEGKTEEAISAFTDIIQASRETGHILTLMATAHQLSDVYFEGGHLQKAETLLHSMLTSHLLEIPAAGMVYGGLGRVAYERNEWETAVPYLQKAINLLQDGITLAHSSILSARIQFTMGDTEAARMALQEADATMRQLPPKIISTSLAGLKIRTALFMDNLELASNLLRELGIRPKGNVTYQNEYQMLSLARVRMAQGRIDADAVILEDVVQLLKRVENTAVTANRHARVMEANMLQALAYDAAGQRAQAVPLLKKALKLAEVEGYVRTFVDEGKPMANLLRALPATPFISQLLAVFPEHVSSSKDQSALVESLSERELEVLHLAAKDNSYKEIAAQIVVSLNTVRHHMKNIYTKLGVNKRSQAIAKAKEHGLL